MADVHDMSYYKKCMVGGIFACGLTHAAVCPMDIVKCRKQANPKMYKSIGDGFRTILATEGPVGLTLVSSFYRPSRTQRQCFLPGSTASLNG